MKNKYCGKASCPWEMAHRHLDDGSVLVRSAIVVPEDILWPRPTTPKDSDESK